MIIYLKSEKGHSRLFKVIFFRPFEPDDFQSEEGSSHHQQDGHLETADDEVGAVLVQGTGPDLNARDEHQDEDGDEEEERHVGFMELGKENEVRRDEGVGGATEVHHEEGTKEK